MFLFFFRTKRTQPGLTKTFYDLKLDSVCAIQRTSFLHLIPNGLEFGAIWHCPQTCQYQGFTSTPSHSIQYRLRLIQTSLKKSKTWSVPMHIMETNIYSVNGITIWLFYKYVLYYYYYYYYVYLYSTITMLITMIITLILTMVITMISTNNGITMNYYYYGYYYCLLLLIILFLQGGAPIVISWFIIPLTIDITPINPSYWTYKPT